MTDPNTEIKAEMPEEIFCTKNEDGYVICSEKTWDDYDTKCSLKYVRADCETDDKTTNLLRLEMEDNDRLRDENKAFKSDLDEVRERDKAASSNYKLIDRKS